MAKPTIKLRNNVTINGAHFDERVVRIIHVARDTAPAFVDGTLWVTSANDGVHMQGSRHFTNRAFDFRVKNIAGLVSKEGPLWAARMRKLLGDRYDVVWEHDHIHVEVR